MKPPHKLAVFCHITKTAGTTLGYLMRRNFGLAHLNVGTRKGGRYNEQALRWDLRINPLLRSVAGHPLHPYVDFGALAPRMAWYTFLREPLRRTISAYQHNVERKDPTLTMERFLRSPHTFNQQVKALCGALDLDAAKELLATRFRFVGLQERFDESLLLLRRRLELSDFELAYERPRNTARDSDLRQRILEQMDRYEPMILDNNQLDLQLHRWVVDELYPRQVAEYGELRLRRDLERVFGPRQDSARERIRMLQNKAFRIGVYLPFVKAFGRHTHPLLER